MNLDDIKKIAAPILEAQLKKFGFRSLEVQEEADSNSETETILLVTAKYGDGAKEPEPRASLEAEVALKRALYEKGETRAVYLVHALPSDAESLPSET